ncbi:hypothetical protein TWF694_000129 [Orbilia ellipsospora]|uniref:Uncharacterized protein n=1 Tax=Orbilia ellipsospora TaxID=2528407 RepID=A0AAV9XPF6_9PEZI
MSLNPNQATRRQFSESMLAANPDSHATEQYTTLFRATQHLLSLLANHPGMVETGNASQPFMQPANSKNRIYAMWDFVGRTMGMITSVGSPSNPSGDGMWVDALGRSQMANMLIQNQDMGDQMHQASWGAGFDRRWEFGDEVKAAAAAVSAAASST